MDGLLIILGIYIVFTVLGAIQKKQREERSRRSGPSGVPGGGDPRALPPEIAARLGLGGGAAASPRLASEDERGLSVLQRALRELQRAEAEAEAARRSPGVPASFSYDSEAGEDGEESQEQILGAEAVSFDDESALEVDERQRAALSEESASVARVEGGTGERAESAAPARIESRIVSAIVPAVAAPEDEERPESLGRSRRASRRRGDLSRFAAGGARGAVVLSEILQRPVGERG